MFHRRPDGRGVPAAPEGARPGAGPHIVSAFDQDLAAIAAGAARLGGLSEELVSLALGALAGAAGPEAGARAQADRARAAQEAQALSDRAALVLARRQPVARDLRQVLGTLRLIAALSRSCDLAANTVARAERRDRAAPLRPGGPEAAVARLGQRALAQLSGALSAFQARDAARARAVWSRDPEIDAHHDSVGVALLARMAEDPAEVAPGAQLLFAAKNLERIADQARRVAAAAWWMETGEEIDPAP